MRKAVSLDERTQMELAAAAFDMLAWILRMKGRRLDAAYLQSTHKLHVSDRPKQPLGPPIFEPVVIRALDAAEAPLIRTMRNVRRRDRKRGRSPTKWA